MLRRVSASALSCKSRFDLTLRTIANLNGHKKAMSTKATLDVAGVYPPVATPFDSSENIDYTKLEQNFQRWDKMPFRGYVVQGSNGEYAYMSKEERVAMVAWACKRTPKEKLIIAGSGCESTKDTIEMSQKMAAAGADALLVVTPCFYKGGMTNSALKTHFTKVADESPVPVILYSVPANTGLDLDAEVAISLSEHPNIIGMKDSGGDISKIGYIVYKTQSSGFQVLAGSASFLFPALAVGCVGGVCALANVLGDACCELQQLVTDGKLEQAKQLQHRLIAPNGAVTKRFGIAGLKQAMEWFGFYGGPTRSPLQPLSPENTAILRQIFESNKFL